MTTIFPFRGLVYNKKKIKHYSPVVAQPYDKIDRKIQTACYRKHRYNIVRIIKGKEMRGDNEHHNKYTRAAEFLNRWLKGRIIVQDKKPAIYAYYQDYKMGDTVKTRKGFIALGKLVEFGKGGVHPHERTLLKPKQDRLNLMRQTGGTAGQVFMLYSDTELVINKTLDQVAQKRKPDISARDEYGETHRVWRITQPKLIRTITRTMAKKDVFIADGHHRYETALNYRNEMRKQGRKIKGNESYDNRMMTFVNMDDAGLSVLPSHRLIYGLALNRSGSGLAQFSFKRLEKRLQRYFWINEYPFFNRIDEKMARTELLEDLRIDGYSGHCFGLAAKGIKKYFLLTLRDENIMDKVIPVRRGGGKEKHSPAWKRLDVTILHNLVLERMLGIGKKKLEREENVRYARYADEAIDAVKSGRFQMAFLMNPTRIDEVKKVAEKGERMPQKSTDFYPKLLSGIVISKINFQQ